MSLTERERERLEAAVPPLARGWCDALDPVVAEMLAEAWDQGRKSGVDDMAAGTPWQDLQRNPYRDGAVSR